MILKNTKNSWFSKTQCWSYGEKTEGNMFDLLVLIPLVYISPYFATREATTIYYEIGNYWGRKKRDTLGRPWAGAEEGKGEARPQAEPRRWVWKITLWMGGGEMPKFAV